MKRAKTGTFEPTISGLLTKRTEMFGKVAAIRAGLARIQSGIENVDRAPTVCGYTGDMEATMAGARREVAFGKVSYPSIFDKLREAEGPLKSRQIAERVSSVHWDLGTGQFMEVKQSDGPFKGVAKEPDGRDSPKS